MREQETYWTFKAPPTPEFSDLPTGAFVGTEKGWNSLSPGYRREIYRSAMKRQSAIENTVSEDAERLARADAKYHQSQVQIEARETL